MKHIEYEYITRKNDLRDINSMRKIDHIGKNLYVYDLTPLAFLSLRHLKLYKSFGLEDYDQDIRDYIENIIMERTLNIVLSKTSFDYYINNITRYIELIQDYSYDAIMAQPIIDYEDMHAISTITEYVYKFYNVMNIILAGSININYNLKDLDHTDTIPWHNAFYIMDYCINKMTKTYRLEIARYYYYDKENNEKSIQ